MAIRRLEGGSKWNRGAGQSERPQATVSTLPTVKAMVNCFERYLNLTIADGNASPDTIKTYRNPDFSRHLFFLRRSRSLTQSPSLIPPLAIVINQRLLRIRLGVKP
ncbi:MAG: hypothetical protein QNJ65_04235 [Xenococcaceae cyanobacterium MO_234.B1]|nr:hypothetical protein [Xenococcaceae cyanobacterium MO_234.B1]